MSSYGFKLFKLTVVKRDGRTPLDWELPIGDSKKAFLDLVESVMRTHVAIPERGLPPGPDARPLTQAEQKARPVFQIEKIKRRGANNLYVELRYGRHKDEDKGLPATELVTGAVDLTDYAPTRLYRLGIFAPNTGATGMMAVEAIAGACPSRYFVKWLRRWMLDAATKPGDVTDEWYKLSANATVDPELLRKYIKAASADRAYLVQRGVQGSRLHRDERFRIEAAVFGNQSERVMNLVEQAITAETTEEHADANYAEKLAEVLGADLSNLSFDDGWVVIDTESGPQSISPTRVPEIFTYPIGRERPSDSSFRTETKSETIRLRKSIEANVDLNGW